MADISFDDLIPKTPPKVPFSASDDVSFGDLIPKEPPTSISRLIGKVAQGATPPAIGALGGGTLMSPLGPAASAAGATVGSLAVPLGDAVNTLYNMGARAVGLDEYQLGMVSDYIRSLMNKSSLYDPPRNQPERIAKTVGSAIGGVGTQVPAAAKLAQTGATALTRHIGKQLAAAPKTQTVVAPVSAAAGQYTAEETKSPLAGLAASIFSGVLIGKGGAKLKTRDIFSNNTLNSAKLKRMATASYTNADKAGVMVKTDTMQSVKEKIIQKIKEQGYDPDLHPGMRKVLKRFSQDAKDMTLGEIDRTRRVLLKVMKDRAAKYDEDRIASDALRVLDDQISSLKPSHLVSGDVEGVKHLNIARKLWAKKAKTEIIENVIESAELDAQNYSQSGMENALRQQFKHLYKNKRRLRQFNKKEQALIKKAATGGPILSTMRLIGKFNPRGVVTTLGGPAAGGYFGDTFFPGIGAPIGIVGVPTAGFLGQTGATALRKARVNKILNAVSGGSPKTQAPNMGPSVLRSIISNPDFGLLGP